MATNLPSLFRYLSNQPWLAPLLSGGAPVVGQPPRLRGRLERREPADASSSENEPRANFFQVSLYFRLTKMTFIIVEVAQELVSFGELKCMRSLSP